MSEGLANVIHRLDKMDSTLEKLTSAMTTLVKFEAEQQQQKAAQQHTTKWLEDHEKRIRTVEIESSATHVRVGAGERLFWVFISLVGSVLTGVVVWSISHPGVAS